MVDMFKKANFLLFFILTIISLLLCIDLFLFDARPSSFDGLTHMVNMAQYNVALSQGDFPVRWQDGFANYGMPIPLFGHQITSYLGALFIFLTNDPLTGYNLVIFFGALLSVGGFYLFLREYTDKWSALIGVLLFNFAPYRIINIFIRGAIPEFFSHAYTGFMLVALKRYVEKNQTRYLFMYTVLASLLLQTHPIAFLVQYILITPYYLYLVFIKKGNILKSILIFIASTLLAIGISGYYIIPLLSEFKYFYYGTQSGLFLPNHFLTIKNFFQPAWYYFYNGDTTTRGNFLHIGGIELMIISMAFLAYLVNLKKIGKREWLGPLLLATFFVYVFFLTRYSVFFYEHIKMLGNIQHQWRMLTGLIVIPPLLCAFLISKIKSKNIQIVIGVVVVLYVALLRFPQLYGKNYVIENKKTYTFTIDNLYAQVYNTIWTGPTQSYPVKKVKGEIIEGKGKIEKRVERNSWRTYEVIVKSPEIRLVDNTFYFPGWKVFVDKKEVPIEFQDMNYRGVITYRIPEGRHIVEVKFTNTKVRLLANIISILSIGTLGLLVIFRKRLFHHPTKDRT